MKLDFCDLLWLGKKKEPTDIIDTNGPQHFIASQQHISIIHLSLMP